jgi:hypothetical protein
MRIQSLENYFPSFLILNEGCPLKAVVNIRGSGLDTPIVSEIDLTEK